MAALIAGLLIVLPVAFAVPWFVLVPIAVVILFVACLVALAVARMSPLEAVRRTATRKPHLLGPGDPDDLTI
jgi:hypothetical protein